MSKLGYVEHVTANRHLLLLIIRTFLSIFKPGDILYFSYVNKSNEKQTKTNNLLVRFLILFDFPNVSVALSLKPVCSC